MLILHIDNLVWKSVFSQKEKTNAIYRKSKKIQRTSIRSNLKKVGTKKYKEFSSKLLTLFFMELHVQIGQLFYDFEHQS